VRGVILDPSCSGSGTVFNRMDHFLPSVQRRQQQHDEIAEGAGGSGVPEDEHTDAGRIRHLANFQVRDRFFFALNHKSRV